MPRLIDIAREVLGETVSNILNCENCHSVDDFLLNYETIRKANQHTVGEQVEYYKPFSRCHLATMCGREVTVCSLELPLIGRETQKKDQ